MRAWFDADNGHWIKVRKGQRPLAGWTHTDLVQISTALAHGRLNSRPVLLAVYGMSLRRLCGDNVDGRGLSAREVSVLVWVQARLYLTPRLRDVYGGFPDVASCALLRRAEGADRPRTPRSKPTSRGPSSCSGNTPTPSRGCSVSCSAPRLDGGGGAMQPEHAHQLW